MGFSYRVDDNMVGWDREQCCCMVFPTQSLHLQPPEMLAMSLCNAQMEEF